MPKDETADEPKTELETATETLISTREAPKGVDAAMEELHKIDEEAHVLWSTGGPRKSRIDTLAAALVEIDGARRVIVIAGMESGAFKLYAELPKGVTLSALYDHG